MKNLQKLLIILFLSGLIMAQNSTTEILFKTNKLDKYFSEKELGVSLENKNLVFRLFTPTADKVQLYISDILNFSSGDLFEMEKDSNGVWEVILPKTSDFFYYGYKVHNKFSENPPISIDPYSKAVTTLNIYGNPRLSIYMQNDYQWKSENKWIARNWKDFIIYEMHIRDLTAHETAKTNQAGTYSGLVEKNQVGGINYIKNLGVNAIELLPTQEFGNLEIPFNKEFNGKLNTWNPYERNHWGYMTAAFFAPSAYYSEQWENYEMNSWMGTKGNQVTEFKKMVDEFHQNGISVIMDVVYNHLSEYEIGNLKEISKEYYFRLDNKGNYIAESYCGNDLRTEAPMFRKLIVESILYWMNEYHIDGFRFDLAKLIDWETTEEIIAQAKKINPNVIIIAEPWGGGYDPAGFSERGWAAWNDQIRNGIKGQNVNDGLGWIFGKWQGNNSFNRIKSYVRGTLVKDSLGLFQEESHSVNYLESHDDLTLGDFIRLCLKKVKEHQKIENLSEHNKLTEVELKMHKLAALFLFTSRGITMIHEGQEFARSKVIDVGDSTIDSHFGEIDHNTYNKDNKTNYLNFDFAKLNADLTDYYKGLIDLRKNANAFRRAKYDDVTFIDVANNDFVIAYTVQYENEKYFVVMNANPKEDLKIEFPEGVWSEVVNPKKVNLKGKIVKEKELKVCPTSGYVFRLEK